MNLRESIRAAQLAAPTVTAEGAACLEFSFAANDPTFAGHFPTRPLLPGIFQLDLVLHAAEVVANSPLAIREITKAKFLRPIIPEEKIRLELQLVDKADAIQARARFTVMGQAAGEVILLLTKSS